MDVAGDVIDLLATRDRARAREIAARLDRLNADRQEEERRILQEIIKRFEGDPSLGQAYCVVVDGEGWHRGVIGITATRIVERYGRPTLVISREGEEAHGSGRSIHSFHLLDAIESCSGLFTRYGGHAHACGFALPAARIPALREQLDAYARQRLTPADFEPVLRVDAALPISGVTPGLLAMLRSLAPFGLGNPEPVFTAGNVRLMAPPRVIKEKHVRLRLASNPASFDPGCHPDSSVEPRRSWKDAITYDAMGWRLAEQAAALQLLPGDALDIAYTVSENDHPEYGGLELVLSGLRRPQLQPATVSAGTL